MKTHQLIFQKNTLDSIVQDLYPLLAKTSVFTLSGPLGAGKTTLIQALLRNAGIDEPIQSPTFSTLNSYSNARGEYFHHFDLYRMKNPHEFIMGGFDEYFYEPADIELQKKIATLKAQTASSITTARNPEKIEENKFVDQWTARTFEHISKDIVAQKPLDPALITEAAATIDALSTGFSRDFDAWKKLGGTPLGTIAWNGIKKAAREANKQN